jgi:hypothetical protein
MKSAAACAVLFLSFAGAANAQTPQHDHAAMAQAGPWHTMQDGVVFLTMNHQGSERGGDEFAVQNWWMGMATRQAGAGILRMAVMFSLEPATLGNDGYREIFQAGETADDRPLIDRQHPHDFLMQASIVWSTPISPNYILTLAGAPVGEPTLGPVAFMHRASAFENPTAPLAHHTFDSTHIAMGVVAAGLERGRWRAEGSVFHGGEPDEQRWDLMDPGALDSWAVRGWFRPSNEWSFQISHGFLTQPEAHEPGDVRRTTASASWFKKRDRGWTAATAAYGRNNKIGGDFNAYLGELSHLFGANTIYSRIESVQVESDLLRFGRHGILGGRKDAHVPDTGEGRDVVTMLTIGGARRIAQPKAWDVAAGADVSFYGVPDILEPFYGDRPVSFHVFVRLRPPSRGGTLRMMESTMTQR